MEDKEKDKKKILIIDDTKPIRMLLYMKLKNEFDCLLASNGKEAIQIAKDEKDSIDVIISDYEMPKMNGYQTLRVMRLFVKKAPVIMLSGSLNESRIKELMSLGVRKFLAKPVNFHRLYEELNNIFKEKNIQ
ncbi:hypothetical protein DRQ09_03615 [candidate division KSB1 bacterium]|nr:MAG: hypothetical protein DRQ09_03615 [candidate division KSB1 bacterium]